MLRDLCLLKSFQGDVKRKQTYADIFSSMFCIKLQSHFTHPSLFTGDEQLKKNQKLHKAYCGSRRSCTMSDNLPQVMSFESTPVWKWMSEKARKNGVYQASGSHSSSPLEAPVHNRVLGNRFNSLRSALFQLLILNFLSLSLCRSLKNVCFPSDQISVKMIYFIYNQLTVWLTAQETIPYIFWFDSLKNGIIRLLSFLFILSLYTEYL